jgi:hypothetical protein
VRKIISKVIIIKYCLLKFASAASKLTCLLPTETSKPLCPTDFLHSSRCTRRMQEGKKLVKKLSGTLKDSASSAENNFQSYHYKILPTQICQRSKQINLPTAYCLLKPASPFVLRTFCIPLVALVGCKKGKTLFMCCVD